MKIIKLTSDTDGKALYVNFSHVLFFWEQEDGTSRIALSDGTYIGHVKETPWEIVKMIEFN